MKKNYKYFLKLILGINMILLVTALYAQDEPKEEKDTRPVRSPFESTILIENQTSVIPNPGAFELIIHHRFANFDNGITDLYGIYGASNIRLGLVYGINKRFSISFGTERANKMQEFALKAKILEQTRSNSIPLSITYFGNAVINGNLVATDYDSTFSFASRLSYFNQLIFSKKFNDKLSLQIAPSYTHFNSVDTSKYSYDYFGLSIGGRYQIWTGKSVIFEFTQPFAMYSITTEPKPQYSIGMEFGTSTHCFQVFATNYYQIVQQQNILSNQNDFFKKGGMMIGFNITVRLN